MLSLAYITVSSAGKNVREPGTGVKWYLVVVVMWFLALELVWIVMIPKKTPSVLCVRDFWVYWPKASTLSGSVGWGRCH